MRFEVKGSQIECRDQCLWCCADIVGVGSTQEGARSACADAAAEHQCDPKYRRNERSSA